LNWIAGTMRDKPSRLARLSTPGTFSIVATSPKSRLLGVAVASGSTAVGNRVPHIRPGVGAVATQAYTNVRYGTKGLQLMERGMSPREALDWILRKDTARDLRQVAMMDTKGNKAVFTGSRTPEWRGQKTGKDYVVIGNLLAGRKVLDRMAEEFERSEEHLVWRMMRVLSTAKESGGDRRGERSAALLMADPTSIKVDIRIDMDKEPIDALRRRMETSFARSFP